MDKRPLKPMGCPRGNKMKQRVRQVRDGLDNDAIPKPLSSTTLPPMIPRFIYLDTAALSNFVADIENGLLTESMRRSQRTGTRSGELSVRVAKGGGEAVTEEEQSASYADTDAARFRRLLAAASNDPEGLGWIEVLDPDADLAGVGIGAFVAWECEIFVPDVVAALARSGEVLPALGLLQNLMPTAQALGLATPVGVPNVDQLGAAAKFINGLDAKLVVVGEDDDTSWRIAGDIDADFLQGSLEGRVRVIGKVNRVLKPGKFKPFLTFPGMNIMGREAKRKAEARGPKPGEEDQFLSGPAVMLDLLAIYR